MLDARVKRALVTGGASGIGLAVVQRLVTEGTIVMAVDRDEKGLDRARAAGAETLAADLATEEGIHRAAAAVSKLDYLVNAAGVIRMAPIETADLAHWRWTFAVNLDAVFFLSQAVMDKLRPGGAIVNISSMAAKTSDPEFAAYCATKAAVISVTRSFALALGDRRVRVNAICPGIIDTPMQDAFLPDVAALRGVTVEDYQIGRIKNVPLQRIGTAEDCAALICFLLSDGASYMTGQAINLTGGLITY